MAVNSYATLDDLGAYLGSEPPADSSRLLVQAQRLVAASLRTATYATDTAGENPTDATVIAALKLATVAQVEFWIASGDELDALGNWTSYTMAGLSVTRAAESRRSRLCDRAVDALQEAKLLPGTIFST